MDSRNNIATGLEEPIATISPVQLNAFWDTEESKLLNANDWVNYYSKWRVAMQQDMSKGRADCGIPKVIHQVWIGPKPSPCLWMDTWRMYVREQNDGDQGSDWKYVVWDDDKVQSLLIKENKFRNLDLYESEKSHQCKADILRLEILYQYGGIYIDADIVRTKKTDLERLVSEANETGGFMIAFEPDSKGKPYSVLGNSVIIARQGHPLLLLLIKYLKLVYPAKRHRLAAEWVSGPLMYTKALIQPRSSNVTVVNNQSTMTGTMNTDLASSLFVESRMLSVKPSLEFYPLFHYIPDPDELDASSMDQSHFLQFGYTCSNLESYIESKNQCMISEQCPYHSKLKDWPFGHKSDFDTADQAGMISKSKAGGGASDLFIHQFSFQADPVRRPKKYMVTWSRLSGFAQRLWTMADLKAEGKRMPFLGANLYSDVKKMDSHTLRLLSLEILYRYGGLFVPNGTSCKNAKKLGELLISKCSKGSSMELPGGMLFTPQAGGDECWNQLKAAYYRPVSKPQVGVQDQVMASIATCIIDSRFGDADLAYLDFPLDTDYEVFKRKFAGVEEVYDASMQKCPNESLLLWSYFCDMACYKPATIQELFDMLKKSSRRALVVFSEEACWRNQQSDSVLSIVNQIDSFIPEWDLVIMALRYNISYADEKEFEIMFPTLPLTQENQKYVAFICNFARSEKIVLSMERASRQLHQEEEDAESESRRLNSGMQGLQISRGNSAKKPALDTTSSLELVCVQELKKQERSYSIFLGVQNFGFEYKQVLFLNALDRIHHAFRVLADHDAPISWEKFEIHGNLLRGLAHLDEHDNFRLCLEVSLDGDEAAMYRSWNDNGGVNCEMRLRISPRSNKDFVEWGRVYYDHQAIKQLSNTPVSKALGS